MTTKNTQTTIAEVIETPGAISPAQQTPMTLLQIAVQANADPDRLAKLMDLQERWERNQAAQAFAAALAKFQSMCPIITKRRGVSLSGNKQIPDYLYASFDDIMKQIGPVLAECSLSLSFSASMTDNGMLTAVCYVRCGTHVQESSITLPIPAQMRVNDTQKMGAALAYAKRYVMCAALNIVISNEDTDAAGMVATITEDQAIQIREMAEQANVDMPKFLSWAGCERIEDIPASKFADAFRMIKAKLEGKK